MGYLAHVSVETIEEWLDTANYNTLELDDVHDILLVFARELKAMKRTAADTARAAAQAANTASCLANGIQPD